jgi:FdhD protein
MGEASARVSSLKVSGSDVALRERLVPVETPVAFVYNGTTYAVMMASPDDLDAFALGFSLSEGIVGGKDEIGSLDIVRHDLGIELRMWLDAGRASRLTERRRHLAGPTGCGLCGIESLDEAVAACPTVGGDARFTPADVTKALAALAPGQVLNRRTQAVHGAGFWTRERGLVAIAEDVGRHNALDKLAGKLALEGFDPSTGVVLLTSRVSVEMVQKTAMAGAPMIVAVSAPTDLAIRTAEAAGITLVAVARQDGFEVFTHPERLGLDGAGRPVKIRKAEHAA